MKKFAISPEYCLILKALHEADSLRQAAAKLNMDPSALTRKIQLMNEEHEVVKKIHNRWQLTDKGLGLIAWLESTLLAQEEVLNEKKRIRFATTMWLSEQLLVPKIPDLKNVMTSRFNIHITTPGLEFEKALLENTADFAIACHAPENPEIEHKKMMGENWIAICSSKLIPKNKKAHFSALSQLPFIRHSNLNTDFFFKTDEVPVQECEFSLDNLISVRSAVINGYGWSLVPKILMNSFEDNPTITLIPLDKDLSDRKICLWWLRSRKDLKSLSPKIADTLLA